MWEKPQTASPSCRHGTFHTSAPFLILYKKWHFWKQWVQFPHFIFIVFRICGHHFDISITHQPVPAANGAYKRPFPGVLIKNICMWQMRRCDWKSSVWKVRCVLVEIPDPPWRPPLRRGGGRACRRCRPSVGLVAIESQWCLQVEPLRKLWTGLRETWQFR